MNRFYRFVALAVILSALGCVRGPRLQHHGSAQYGLASWYGRDFQGRPTASGELFDMYAYTAAHRDLPFGTRLRVTNEANGRSVVVRINDRGPWVEGRILDLSYAAAKELGMIEAGVIRVRLEVLR